jgi:hypothetical protein
MAHYTDVGIDTSHWRPKLDRIKLKGLKWLIGRMGTQQHNIDVTGWMDHTFTDHCQVAKDLDCPFGAFWYDDYTWFLDNGWTWGAINELTPQNDPRITVIKRALFSGSALRRVHFLGIDVEQETRNGVKTKEPNWCSKSAQSLFENLLWLMNHDELPVLPILIYTRASFVSDYCAPLSVWMKNYYDSLGPDRIGVWIADWRYNRCNDGIYTAAELQNTLPLESAKPAMFGSVPAWLWQYAGDVGRKAYLDGVSDDRNIPLATDLDTNVIPLDEFYRRIKFTPGEVVPPPPPAAGDGITIEDLDSATTTVLDRMDELEELIKSGRLSWG